MKSFFIVCTMSILIDFNVGFSQTLKSFLFEGNTRQYLEYVPANYTPSEPLPLVICLHGLGDNINNFKNIGMHLIGDTARFITLYPQAMPSLIGNAWNAGIAYMGYMLNANINDVGFLIKLIDTTMSIYSIDSSKIYICGFSLGGFMSNRMACEATHRISAIASVAGTIGNAITCNPSRPIPVCHFHGTADSTVSYSNNAYGMNTEPFINFWVLANQCDTNYLWQVYPNIVADNIMVESFLYTQPNHADVMLYKAINAGHQWLYLPANDISYTFEIWKFFRKYSFYTQIHTTKESQQNTVLLYPNPTFSGYLSLSEHINISDGIIELFDMTGKCVFRSSLNIKQINISSLTNGLYTAKIQFNQQLHYQKIIIANNFK